MDAFSIKPCALDARCEALRSDVRGFLEDALAGRSPAQKAESWNGFDREFSRALGAKGWIGMTWPRRYGGHERTALERYVVLEEVLAAGAPVAAHWVADRQSGPLLLAHADEETRLQLLPAMARGELVFCIGMSEPDSGSDLASIRTRAERVGDGWKLYGTKLWSSHASRADFMIALVRTSALKEAKHAGLSQFLVDLSTPGIEVRPVKNLLKEPDFCEVVFDGAYVPQHALLGREGDGWSQVTAELALERSGPERYLSSVQLMVEMLQAASAGDRHQAVEIGRLVADFATLRRMSLGVAGMLSSGTSAGTLAPLVKDQGALLEQHIPEVAHDLFGGAMDRVPSLEAVMRYTVQAAPSFSLRGGTREILRGIVARELGLR